MPCDLEVGPSRSQYPHELAYEPWSSTMLVVVGIACERRAPGAAGAAEKVRGSLSGNPPT